jgi:hypothetical protein
VHRALLASQRPAEALAEFGTLWRNPGVPDRLREEALLEIVARCDVDGPNLVAVHPQPNENAWLLGKLALADRGRSGMWEWSGREETHRQNRP